MLNGVLSEQMYLNRRNFHGKILLGGEQNLRESKPEICEGQVSPSFMILSEKIVNINVVSLEIAKTT